MIVFREWLSSTEILMETLCLWLEALIVSRLTFNIHLEHLVSMHKIPTSIPRYKVLTYQASRNTANTSWMIRHLKVQTEEEATSSYQGFRVWGNLMIWVQGCHLLLAELLLKTWLATRIKATTCRHLISHIFWSLRKWRITRSLCYHQV